MKDKIFCFV